jgi:asparagine synthase (glutamine-hydrolysing)
MLGRMADRGVERVGLWREGGVVLAVGRYEWELGEGFSGPDLIAEGEDVVVAADASIFYRAELRRALAARGVVPVRETPAHLILAAYRAWGDDCANYLDGDLSFILWDRGRRRVLCVRDPSGKRPVHYAELGGELVVASTIGGVAAHPRCPEELNLPLIAGTISGMHFAAGPETCYRTIRVLPNAHTFSWSEGRLAGPTRYWETPVDAEPSRLSFDDAAEELRDLLATAVRERLLPGETNTVWLSGGWDSTAVFGAAGHLTRRDGLDLDIRPVSISYPEGDPGREDEWIQAIADQWEVPVHWIDITDIPFLEDEERRAEQRDEPYAHLYERWNGALAAGTRACGSRIALDGNGGDQLFQNTDVFLADLFRQGRWLRLAREWPMRPRGGFRPFFSAAIQPNLSPWMHDLATWIRGGRRLKSYLERGVRPWVDADFAKHHRLEERDLDHVGRPHIASHALREIDWQFTNLFIARAFGLITTFALRNGVEMRSPLSDRRVIDFALSRPWWERSSGKETKLLVRRAMQGLLPDEVLAPRPYRTGITGGYSHRWMVEVFPALLERTLSKPLILEELGIVHTEALRRACAEYPRHGDPNVRVGLYYTLQAELWLRARQERRAEPKPVEAGAITVTTERGHEEQVITFANR